jgi:hypothetical protein
MTQPDIPHQSPKRPNLRTSDTLCVGSTKGGKGPPESFDGLLWVLPEWLLIRIVDGFCGIIVSGHKFEVPKHTDRLVTGIPLQSRVLALFVIVRIDRCPRLIVVWLREEQRLRLERGLGLDQRRSNVELRGTWGSRPSCWWWHPGWLLWPLLPWRNRSCLSRAVVGLGSRFVGCGIQSWPGSLCGGFTLTLLLHCCALLIHRHQDKVAVDAVTAIENLHWPARSRVGGAEVTARIISVLENGTKIPDTDNDVKLVGHFDVVELVHLHRDRGVEWFLQYS